VILSKKEMDAITRLYASVYYLAFIVKRDVV